MHRGQNLLKVLASALLDFFESVCSILKAQLAIDHSVADAEDDQTPRDGCPQVSEKASEAEPVHRRAVSSVDRTVLC